MLEPAEVPTVGQLGRLHDAEQLAINVTKIAANPEHAPPLYSGQLELIREERHSYGQGSLSICHLTSSADLLRGSGYGFRGGPPVLTGDV